MGIPSGDFPDTPLSFLMDSSTDNAVDSSNDYRFNPIKSQKNEYRKSYTNNLQMNGFAEYEVLKGLKLKVSAGYTYDSRKQDQFNNSNTRYGGPTSTDKVNAQVTRQERLTWLNENTLTYQTNIKRNTSSMYWEVSRSRTRTMRFIHSAQRTSPTNHSVWQA